MLSWTVDELVSIRNAFDAKHRVTSEARHRRYGGQKIKECSIEFDPIDSVRYVLLTVVHEICAIKAHAEQLTHELLTALLDTAHNAAIELLGWRELHVYVIGQFDRLIEAHRNA